MYKKAKMLIAIVIFFGLLFPISASSCVRNSQNPLDYQDRGDRCEGVHPQLVGSYDIELISAVVKYREPINRLPEFFKLKFCLPRHLNKVNVKVRELEYEHYYRMDKPNISSNEGCGNFFQWSTTEVIRSLTGLNIADLGALIRLGNNQRPNKKEEVAPVILYSGNHPNRISGYAFTFTTNRDARIRYSIRNENTRRNVVTENRYSRKKGNKPFQISWNDTPTGNGFYKLILKGYFVSNGESIRQSVRFYHKSRIN